MRLQEAEAEAKAKAEAAEAAAAAAAPPKPRTRGKRGGAKKTGDQRSAAKRGLRCEEGSVASEASDAGSLMSDLGQEGAEAHAQLGGEARAELAALEERLKATSLEEEGGSSLS